MLFPRTLLAYFFVVTSSMGMCWSQDESLPVETSTILDILSSEEDFTTLISALTSTGLITVLEAPGPYTLFAPTNSAFEAIPEDEKTLLFSNSEALLALLQYHVIQGMLLSTDTLQLTTVVTLNGDSLAFTQEDGFRVNGASMLVSNIATSNGVIHIVDSVLRPVVTTVAVVEPSTIASILQISPDLSYFVTMLENSERMGQFEGTGPFTLFVPTDAVFSQMNSTEVETLMNNPLQLADVVNQHWRISRALMSQDAPVSLRLSLEGPFGRLKRPRPRRFQ